MKNEFTPQVIIGRPDTKKEKAIVDNYSEICTVASALLWNLEFFLDCRDKLELSEFFDFLNVKNAKDWLYQSYINHYGLTFPGIAISKIVELGMVDLPVEKMEYLIESRTELLQLIQKSKDLNFFFPLAKLFDATEDNRGFAITNQEWGLVGEVDYLHETKEFDAVLYKTVRNFTASEQENEVLQVINNAVESLNNLIQIGVIRNDRQRWGVDLDNFVRAIVFTLNEERPLSINPNLPRFKGFGKYFEARGWSQIQGGPEDILKFVEPGQIEDNPEVTNQEELLQSEDMDQKQIEYNEKLER